MVMQGIQRTWTAVRSDLADSPHFEFLLPSIFSPSLGKSKLLGAPLEFRCAYSFPALFLQLSKAVPECKRTQWLAEISIRSSLTSELCILHKGKNIEWLILPKWRGLFTFPRASVRLLLGVKPRRCLILGALRS